MAVMDSSTVNSNFQVQISLKESTQGNQSLEEFSWLAVNKCEAFSAMVFSLICVPVGCGFLFFSDSDSFSGNTKWMPP